MPIGAVAAQGPAWTPTVQPKGRAAPAQAGKPRPGVPASGARATDGDNDGGHEGAKGSGALLNIRG